MFYSSSLSFFFFFFFFNDTATTEIYTLSLHDALPIGLSIGPKHVLLSSWFSMTVEKIDRKTGKLVATLGEFAAPVDALEANDGTLYVAELGSGNLVKVSPDGKTRSTIVKELR